MKKLLSLILVLLLLFSLVFSMVSCFDSGKDDDDDDDDFNGNGIDGNAASDALTVMENLEELGYEIENLITDEENLNAIEVSLYNEFSVDVECVVFFNAASENDTLYAYEFATPDDAKKIANVARLNTTHLALNGSLLLIADSFDKTLNDALYGKQNDNGGNNVVIPDIPSALSMNTLKLNLQEAGYLVVVNNEQDFLQYMKKTMKEIFNIDVNFKSVLDASNSTLSTNVSVYELLSKSEAQLISSAAQSKGNKTFVSDSIVIIASSEEALNHAIGLSKPSAPNVPNIPSNPNNPASITVDSIISNLEKYGFSFEIVTDREKLSELEYLFSTLGVDVSISYASNCYNDFSSVEIYECATAEQASSLNNLLGSYEVLCITEGNLFISASDQNVLNTALYGVPYVPNIGADTDTDTDTSTDTENNTQFTIYFDANGGNLSEDEQVRFVEKGSAIGSLPKPIRVGYTFEGWYYDWDEDMEDKIRPTEKPDEDAYLIANWEVNASATVLSVEFDANGGEMEGDVVYDIEKGWKLGDVCSLPTPTREGFVFDGWYAENDRTYQNRYRQTTVVNSNVVLVAKWSKIILCLDGTENHDWSPWQEYTQATCETAQTDERACKICGAKEYAEGAAALGHNWSGYSEEFMKRSHTCYECGKTEHISVNNVTVSALGVGNYPTVDGDAWGIENVGAIINGVLEEDGSLGFAGKGTGAVTVTLDLYNPMAVDVIYVVGLGSASYEVMVTYDDGSEELLGIGSFGRTCEFYNADDKVITKVVIYMEDPSVGADYWTEVALGKTMD